MYEGTVIKTEALHKLFSEGQNWKTYKLQILYNFVWGAEKIT